MSGRVRYGAQSGIVAEERSRDLRSVQIKLEVMAQRAKRAQPYRDEIKRLCAVVARTDYSGVVACKERLGELQREVIRINAGEPPRKAWTGNEALGVWLPKVYRP